MSGVVTAIAAGVSWCFCSATASLCGAWCGNDKPSSVAPSATSGRKRSVLLLAFSVAISLAFQYALGPNYGKLRLEYLVEAWSSGCDHDNQELVKICAGRSRPGQSENSSDSFDFLALTIACILLPGNSGVYRAQGAAFLFFFVFAIAAKCRPTANREAWPAKYILYIFLCIGTVFIPNAPVFVPIFVNIARAGVRPDAGLRLLIAQMAKNQHLSAVAFSLTLSVLLLSSIRPECYLRRIATDNFDRHCLQLERELAREQRKSRTRRRHGQRQEVVGGHSH